MTFFRSTIGRYVAALLSFGAAVGLTYLFGYIWGTRFTGYQYLYLFAIMIAAHGGYGPGILTSLLTTTFASFLFVPGFTLSRIDLNRFFLTMLVSVLISRVSASRARVEEALRKSNEALDERVRQRTAALEAANAAHLESEQRFSLFMRHLPGAAWMKDLEGRYVYVNPTAEQIFHATAENLRGKTDDEIFPPDVARQFKANDRLALSGDPNFQTVETLRQGDGEHYSVVSKFPVLDAGGKPILIGGVAIDITERRKAEQEAASRLAELENIYTAAPIGLGLMDADLRYVRVNEHLAAINGLPVADHIGRTVRELLTPQLADIVEPVHRQVLTTGIPVVGREVQGALLSNPSAQRHWISSYSPVKTEDGRVLGIQLVIQEITEKKHLDERLHHTAKLESVGILAGGIAHDFNNLLVGILGNASLALESIGPDNPAHPIIKEAIVASERAAQLIRQMLAYAGRGRFVIERRDIGDLIRETAPLIQASIPKTVELRLEVPANLPPVEIDVTQMQQLIMNLIINGAEAIPEGEPGTVTVSCSRQLVDNLYRRLSRIDEELKDGPYVCIEVRDTGTGMNETTKSRIFDPFFTTKFTGRGLGLAAGLGIVHGHNGCIQVHSAPGDGSSFRILLPAAAGREVLRESSSPRDAMDIAGRGTVLVIDDEPVVRDLARQTLERYGYAVLLAENGQAGLEMFARSAAGIRAVLLDMTMPVMSGERTMVELRRLNSSVPVVLTSGFDQSDVERRFHGQTTAGFLQKPYLAHELAEKIQRAIQSAGRASA